MTLLGTTLPGPDRVSLAVDHGYGLLVPGGARAEPFVVGSVVAFLDGLGAGAGEQVLRPVAQEVGTNAAAPARGEPVAVEDGQAAGWVHLTFDTPPIIRAGYQLAIGLHAGAASTLARLGGVTAAGQGLNVASSYAGAAPNLAAGAALNLAPALCACGLVPWTPPDTLEDEEIARLPFDVAQATLGSSSGGVPGGVAAACGWHHIAVDPETGSFAIVRTGGPLVDLVGERIRVSAGGRSVIAVVHHELPFDEDAEDEDLSLTRKLFGQLAPLATDTLAVRVEVMP